MSDHGASAFPLQWPEGWERTPDGKRKNYSMFRTTFDKARKELHLELQRLKAKYVVVSTNIPLRLDGNPRADVARLRITDPGVAVYFSLRDRPMVMARDAYWSVHDNLRSIGLGIEHLRGLERHGGATMMERAFEGFAALPEPGNAAHGRPWWKVFDFQQDPSATGPVGKAAILAGCEVIYRQKAKAAHADTGGSHDQMVELNAAIAMARKVLA